MYDAPIRTTRWSPAKIEMFKEVDVFGGRGGIVTFELANNDVTDQLISLYLLGTPLLLLVVYTVEITGVRKTISRFSSLPQSAGAVEYTECICAEE